MPRSYRLAVIVATADGTDQFPSLEDARTFVETGADSVLAYWRDNAGDWFRVDAVDYYGPVPVTDIPAKASRTVIMDKAEAAAGALGPHDLTLVLLAHAAGTSYDCGAAGNRALVPTDLTHTFACHEFGHTVGLNHTCGIPNLGADWSDNGVDDYTPWYGDPYDVMSAMTFADSDPTTTLPPSSAITHFAGATTAGPMLSRAMLHHTAPDGIRADQVQDVYDGGDVPVVVLHPAGSTDATTLLAWHPAGEDVNGRGRVYVEYRQPFDDIPASRWDKGLAAAGDERTRCGVVVHVAKDVPGSDYTAVWYSGRIVPQPADDDVVVDTGRGLVTVTLLTDDGSDASAPRTVRVRVQAGTTAPAVLLHEEPSDQVTVTELPGQLLPGFEVMGPFPRERREVVRTVVYTPRVYGMGGASPYDAATNVNVRWYIGTYMLTDDDGTVERVPAAGGSPVRLRFSIDETTGVLTLSNVDVADAFAMPVECLAVQGATEAKATTTYEVEGTTEGWGEAARRFLDYFDRITHPIPKYKVRIPGWDRLEAVGVEQARQALAEVRPDAVQLLEPLRREQLKAVRGYQPWR